MDYDQEIIKYYGKDLDVEPEEEENE